MSDPPAERRPAIDVARLGALLVVVVGHLAMAVVDRVDGRVRGANLLALEPRWAWVTALAPMPVFFAAGGWANATSTLASAVGRLRSLVGLAAVVVGGWSAAVLVTAAAAGEPGIVADGARLATQPLWFVAAYAPFAAAGSWAARAARMPVRAIGACVSILVVLDLARFVGGAPRWVGWPGFLAAWAVPWLVGAWWRDRTTHTAFGEARAGWALAIGATALAVLLVRFAGYDAALIDAVPGGRSNTNPPTLFTAVAGVGQAGALMAAARSLDRAGRRRPRRWSRAGAVAVPIYVWHLTALGVAAALVAAGLPAPVRLTPAWWLTRPLWFAGVLAIAGALVAATGWVSGHLAGGRPGPGAPDGPVRRLVAVAGVAAAAATAALVGISGPRTPLTASACALGFAAAWALLRAAPLSGSPRARR